MAHIRDRNTVGRVDVAGRDAAVDMTLAQIEKQHGKGAIMRLGDFGTRMSVEVIPTGSLALDLALGVGGLPRGRIVELYGPEGSGKCLTADTYVWTDRGLETVGELFERCGQAASCTARVTDIGELGVRAVNERGELEQVAALTHNGLRPVLRLRLRSGRTITVTHNHPLRVVDESGFIVWREAEHIRPGDTMVSAAFGAVEAASGDGLSEDEAVFLGYLVAEGSLSKRSSVWFTNSDPEVGAEFAQLVNGLFDANIRTYRNAHYVVHDTRVRAELADRYGLDYVTAHGKSVPHCIRTGGHKIQRAFLSALFEGDGWIDKSSTVGIASASEQLARQVQLLLYGFGIPATLSPKYNPKYERDYWTVTINPAAAHRFLDEIGFRSQRRREQVEANFRRSPHDPRFENIPHLSKLLRALRDDARGDRKFDLICGDMFRKNLNLECSRSRLIRIVRWATEREETLSASARAILGYLRELVDSRYTFERVEVVEDGGIQPTFDLMLPRTHSFLANGILSHNTTVSLHVIAEAQKAGGLVAFIDAEHALDPTYAKAVGVDIDNLLVSQPDTGEQALEITDTLVRSGAMDVIVIDSVAALVPRAELEGEMGDTHVGLQARLMSQALRKLTGNVSRTKTVLIFINQIREKIGVMFGSNETTPGGRALKFSSSVRLDVRRIDSLKDGAEIVGSRVRVKVVKNKCVAAGTRVFDPTTGVTHRIEDIVRDGIGMSVWAMDKRGMMHVRPITARFDQGEQDTISLALRDGTTLKVTPDHQIFTEQGWREAGELKVGDRVARPRINNVQRFPESLRMWRRNGRELTNELEAISSKHAGSPTMYLPRTQTEPVLAHLDDLGVTPHLAAATLGLTADQAAGGWTKVLGATRLRRDRLERLADALDSRFLRDVLAEEVYYDPIVAIGELERLATYDIEVDELHNFVAEDVVVHNCAAPFRKAEFDIQYGTGISKEGSLLDVAIDNGIVRKSGAWFIYGDDQLGQGRENAKAFLAENADIATEIELKIKDKLGLLGREDEPEEPPND